MEVLKEIYIGIMVVVCIGVLIFIQVKIQRGDWTTKWVDAGGRSGNGGTFTILVMWSVIYVTREIYRAIFT